MKTRFIIIAACIAMICASSCVPYRYTLTPSVRGTIHDATSQRPIDGAIVTMSTLHSSKTNSTVSDAAGTFELPSIKGWALFSPGMSALWPKAKLEVVAEGYETYAEQYIRTVQHGYSNDSVVGVTHDPGLACQNDDLLLELELNESP